MWLSVQACFINKGWDSSQVQRKISNQACIGIHNLLHLSRPKSRHFLLLWWLALRLALGLSHLHAACKAFLLKDHHCLRWNVYRVRNFCITQLEQCSIPRCQQAAAQLNLERSSCNVFTIIVCYIDSICLSCKTE